jgi:hypothetical protein
MAILSTAAESERFFSSGNERTPADIYQTGIKAGYHVAKEDKWSFIVDLMSQNMMAKDVYLTITFEYVPENEPGFQKTKVIWLDAE